MENTTQENQGHSSQSDNLTGIISQEGTDGNHGLRMSRVICKVVIVISVLVMVALITAISLLLIPKEDKDKITACEPGWSLFQKENKCIRVNYDMFVSWPLARDRCNAENERLLTITDEAIHELIRELILGGGSAAYWIGLSDIGHANHFTWQDGPMLLNFTNWSEGEPNYDEGGGEKCGQMKASLNWNDLLCKLNNNYICEKRGTGCKYMNGGCPEKCSDGTDNQWNVTCTAFSQ